MNTILTTLNAKYIHTSLALRLLYVVSKVEHQLSIQEYTIKDNVINIGDDLLKNAPDIIALGVYIWNVEQTQKLVEYLKIKNPNLIIILGGPEVTYEPSFFIENWSIDYIIRGEGELLLNQLLHEIKKKDSLPSHLIQLDGVYSKDFHTDVIVKADLNFLERCESPYSMDMDRESCKNKIVYFETSRGCPYQCQFCLSSLDKGVRYYSKDYIFKNLKYLLDSEVKVIKFLDRTFNLNKDHTHEIFTFLVDNHRENLSCQFEIYADILSTDMINVLNQILPLNYFRFEIGIQSTYEPTNHAVKRKQNFNKLRDNILHIMRGQKVDLHLDLIAGLPYETFDLFKKSFNDVFAMQAKEVQLGFLKMLRGTGLRKNAKHYGYIYQQVAPYEIVKNNDITEEELHKIHLAEDILEKYWNSGKLKLSMNAVFEELYKDRYFEFFNDFAQYIKKEKLPTHNIQIENLFVNLHTFLCSLDFDIFTILRTDYYNNFGIRPHGFWEPKMDKKTKKSLLYQIGNDKEFLKDNKLTRKMVEKQMTIDFLTSDKYLLTLFDNSKIHRIFHYQVQK